MKKILTLLFVLALYIGAHAQYSMPVDFETALEDTNWTQFANAGDAAENFVLADNPDATGINTSAKCLNFIVQDGADPWAGAWSTAYGAIAITADNHTMQMMVHKDVITNCALKLEGSTDGGANIEVKVPNTVTGAWELITFDFTDAIGYTYATLVFFPDFPDTRTEGSNCYIDNIDGGTTPVFQYTLPADFEIAMEDTNWHQFSNAGDAPENVGIASNPATDGINTSANCYKFVVLDGADPWVGAWANTYGTIAITAENHMMQMMVHKDVVTNCGLKLEGSTDGGPNVEVKVPNTVTGEWELITFDFTDAIGYSYPTLVFFPDFPDPRTVGSTCYIDNIGWGASSNPQFVDPIDFETALGETDWTQFSNAGDAPENFVVVDNPATTGINTSAKCLNFIVQDGADPWVGAWTDAYGDMVFTADNYMLQMMVHKDVISDCALKIENGGDPIEVKVPNTVTGEWELLTFDFTAAIGLTYSRLVLFPDFPDPRTAGSNCYIDNIGWVTGTSVSNIEMTNVNIYPNPANSEIYIDVQTNTSSISMYNLIGQEVKSFQNLKLGSNRLDISDLSEGLYIVTVRDNSNITTTSKLFKQ